MGEFFKGWRRKVGCVTLVMATVLWGGWMRSDFIADFITWPAVKNRTELFYSAERKLVWQTIYDSGEVTGYPSWSPSVLDQNITDEEEDGTVWRFRLCGFEAGEFPSEMTEDSSHAAFCSIPYWSVVIPLTLLSAYLIFWNPRKQVATG